MAQRASSLSKGARIPKFGRRQEIKGFGAATLLGLVWFDASDVMRNGAGEDRHEGLLRLLSSELDRSC